MALDWATTYNEIAAVIPGLTYAEREVGTLVLNLLARYGGPYDATLAADPSIATAENQALADYASALATWIAEASDVNDQSLQALNYVEVNVGRTASTFTFVTAPREEALSSGKNFLGRMAAVAGDADNQSRFGMRDLLKAYSDYFGPFYETYPIQTPSTAAQATLVTIPPMETPVAYPAEKITFPQLEEKLVLLISEGESFLQAIVYIP